MPPDPQCPHQEHLSFGTFLFAILLILVTFPVSLAIPKHDYSITGPNSFGYNSTTKQSILKGNIPFEGSKEALVIFYILFLLKNEN
jgi:hypothetical protein